MWSTLFSSPTSLVLLLASAKAVTAQSCSLPFPIQSYSISSVCLDGLVDTCQNGGAYTDVTGTSWNVQCGQSLTGKYYTSSNSAQNGIAGCFRNCAKRPSCSAFTFIGSVTDQLRGEGVCYYESNSGGSKYVLNATVYASATVVKPNPDLVCPTYGGTSYQTTDGAVWDITCGADMPGIGDASTTSGRGYDMNDCLNQCSKISDCLGVVYDYGGDEYPPGDSPPPAGQCYFKGGTGSTAARADFAVGKRRSAAGVVAYTPNKPPASSPVYNPLACYLGNCRLDTPPVTTGGTTAGNTATGTLPVSPTTAATTTAPSVGLPTLPSNTTGLVDTPSTPSNTTAPTTPPATLPTSTLGGTNPGSQPLPSTMPVPLGSSCSSFNGSLVTDDTGASYYIYCGKAFSGGVYATAPATRGFAECFSNCTNNVFPPAFGRCDAFTFFGNSAGSGQCQFKNAESYTLLGNDPSLVAVIRAENFTPPPNATPTAVATTAPAPGPGSTTTTSPGPVGTAVTSTSGGPIGTAVTSTSGDPVGTAVTSTSGGPVGTTAAASQLPDGTVMPTSQGPAAGSTSVAGSSADLPTISLPSMLSSGTSAMVPSGSSSVFLSNTTAASAPAPTSSAAPPPACGQTVDQVCSSDGTDGGSCASAGTVYNTDCGYVYEGVAIIISNIPSNSTRMAEMARRQAVAGLSLSQCLALCGEQTSPKCAALNYINSQCTLFSSVTGYTKVPGAFAAAIPSDPTVPTIPRASPSITPPTSSSPTSSPSGDFSTITSGGVVIVVPVTTPPSSSSATGVSTVTSCSNLKTLTTTIFNTMSVTTTTCPAVCTSHA